MIGIKSRTDFSSSINYNNNTSVNANNSNLYANHSGMSNVDNGQIESSINTTNHQLNHSVLNSTNQPNGFNVMSSSANDDLKEKKRKMMLPLGGPGSAGSAQTSSNGTTPNESSKRSKILVTPNVANYAQDSSLDLSTSNMLTTPQLERFITELGTNPSLLKTPDSALGLLTPATSSLFFGLGTTPMNGNADPASAYANMQSAGSTLGSNLLNNRSTGLTPNYANINPSDIFMNAANQQHQQQQQQQQQQQHHQSQANGSNSMDYLNNSNKYAILTTVSGDGSSANLMNMQPQQNENMMAGGSGGGSVHLNVNNDMNNTGVKLVGAKDEPQTVPVSASMMNGMNPMVGDANNNSSWPSANGQSTSSKKRNNSTSGSKSKSGGGKKAATNEPVQQQQQQSMRLNHIIQQSESMNNMSSSRHDMHSNASSVASSMSMMNESSYSPADPDKNKVEKKRERNREAARKCRTRKLEKIAELTLQVKELTSINEKERERSQNLSKEIEELKLKMRQHKNSHGCDLNVNI